MVYACETRAYNTQTKRVLRTEEMKILGNLTRYLLIDKKRNEEIGDTCEVQYVVRWEK